MKKLVIAEKPSFARNIESALFLNGEQFKNAGEYDESENYIVTSAFGHIFHLMEIDKYPENAGKNCWEAANLPFFPAERSDGYIFKIKEDAGVKKRFMAIKKLVNSDEIGEVIHCGDADREGQLIVDLILKEAGNTKPVTRPVIKDMTEKTILEAFDNRQPNEMYNNVHDEGLARTLIDYDYGINLSRYANAKTKTSPALNVGRVIGAIVNAVCARDLEIREFVPTKYYEVIGTAAFEDGTLELNAKEQFKNTDEAAVLAKELSAAEIKVVDITGKEKTIPAPKLFSQSSLQNYMSKYKYSPKKTLEIAQSLYEKGYTTYPRTNSEYLTENEKETVRDVIKAHDPENLEFKDNKRIFDETKVSGHTAIIPTTRKPRSEQLSEEEKNVYEAVLRRFMCAFWQELCREMQTELSLEADGKEFKIRGNTEISPGWRTIEKVEKKDKNLPSLKTGQTFKADFKPVEKETTPPKHYTVETLNNYLKNPFRKEKTTEDEEYKAILAGLEIGTEATRAGIIDKAIKKDYISLKDNVYMITHRGEYLVEVMNSLGIDMSKERTTLMSKMTRDIANGKININDALAAVHEEIREIIKSDNAVSAGQAPASPDTVGKCPKCGADVIDIDNPKLQAYKCSGSDCDYILWKNIMGGKLSRGNASKLLKGDQTGAMNLVNKAGKPYAAKIRLKNDFKSFELEFVNKKGGQHGKSGKRY